MYHKINQEEYIKRINQRWGEGEYEVITEYTGSQNPILVKHIKCGKITTANKALYLTSKYRKCACTFCACERGHILLSDKFSKKEEQFLKDIQNKFGDKIIMVGEYYGNRKPTIFKCTKHDCEFTNTPRNVYKSKTGCCPFCSQNKGEDCYRWKGGNSELRDILRHYSLQWSIDSRMFYNRTCLITGKKGKDLHHVFKSFNEMYDETLLNCGYDINKHYNYCDFNVQEQEQLKEEILKLHYQYGYGIPIDDILHKEFHDIYGRGNNTVEQYIEFAASKGVVIREIKKDGLRMLVNNTEQ